MIRRSVLSINEANSCKLDTLSFLTKEMKRVVNLYIDQLWTQNDFHSKFIKFKVDTWLSARLQQCLGKQALEIVKSQRRRKKKTKPVLKRNTFNLDSRFVDFRTGNHFDHWIRLTSLGNRLHIKFPAKSHKHYNKFKDWNRNKSIRLLEKRGKWFVEVFFEKKQPEIRQHGQTIGVDCGYKELVITSDGQHLDDGLEQVYDKIARKKQGSKSFKKALVERDNLINQSINKIKLTNIREIVVEDLKNVKKDTKGKIRKKFNNKLQRWSYPKVLVKLHQLAEENGITFTKVNPAYTSQRCCNCGVICKSNRKGKAYKCACGNEMDADLNAAINISHMGVYSPHALYETFVNVFCNYLTIHQKVSKYSFTLHS